MATPQIHCVPLAVSTYNETTDSWESQTRFPVRAVTSRRFVPRPAHQRQQLNLEHLLPTPNGRKIRLATFNILADTFPWFVEMAIQSPTRFLHLPQILAQPQATIYGLNEVTRRSMTAIQRNSYFRDAGYSQIYFEDLASPNDLRRHTTYGSPAENQGGEQAARMDRPHGCALLIKNDFEVLDAFRIHLDRAAAPVAAILQHAARPDLDTTASSKSNQPDDNNNNNNTVLVGVVAIHTTAYAREDTRAMRRRQLADAKKVMEDMLKKTRERLELPEDTEHRDVVIVMGDLNLHDINEEKSLVDIDMLDAFAETFFVTDYTSRALPNVATLPAQVKNSLAATMGINQDNNTNANTTPENQEFERRLYFALMEHQRFGCTFDAERNPMIPHYIPGEVRKMRLDRILIRPGCSAYFDSYTRMFGEDVVNRETAANVCLSDHYGLYQDLVLLDDANVDGSKLSLQSDDLPLAVRSSNQLELVGQNTVVEAGAAVAVANHHDDNDNNAAAQNVAQPSPSTVRRVLRGNPVVRRVRGFLANIPNDITGVNPGFFVVGWKAISFAVHPFFLLGRKFNWI